MAYMIPSSPYSNFTSGEKKVFQILKLLPAHCVVRFEVLTGYRNMRPDFTISDPQRGVCIVEVKDYLLTQITQATPDQIWVKGYGGSQVPVMQINPIIKCDTYLTVLCDQIAAMPSLRDERNLLKVPVKFFLIFTNISRKDLISSSFVSVLDPSYIIFKEELSNKGAGFMERYEKDLPIMNNPLTSKQQNDLSMTLDPTIVLPSVINVGNFIREDKEVVITDSSLLRTHHLSIEQETIAKSLGEGPRILRGIAGTGKTLILLYRAKLLAANNPQHNILVLCWNTALANYMNQAYEKFPLEAKGKVKICHFSEFVNDLFGFDPFSKWGEEKISIELNKLNIKDADKYNAIFVDEAQDFRKEWIAFIFNRMILGEIKERNFIFAADDAQRIYKRRDFKWDSLDFNFTGRSKILKTIYRNSARIWIFSAFLLKEKASYLLESKEELIFANQGEYEPLILKCKNLDEQIDRVVELCINVNKNGYSFRNILILYRHQTIPGDSHYPLVDNLIKRLKDAKIKSEWISKDSGAKRYFDWDANTVKVSTVHSAKGMDSPIVIVLGVETFNSYKENNNDLEDELNLLYVALTRAREFLVVCYSGNEGLVPQLKECEEEYERYREAILSL